MILRDFGWENFNRSDDVSIFAPFFKKSMISFNTINFISNLHKDLVNFRFLY